MDPEENLDGSGSGGEEEVEAVPGLVPLVVEYCTVCSMPWEYCEHGIAPERCFPALKEANPELYEEFHGDLSVTDAVAALSLKGGKKGKRGGKGVYKLDPEVATDGGDDGNGGAEGGSTSSSSKGPKGKPKKQSGQITITRQKRGGGRKFVTSVAGLQAHVKLPEAKKAFAQKFSCGTSIVTSPSTHEQEIDLQGDVAPTMPAFLKQKWGINPKLCVYVDKVKKKG